MAAGDTHTLENDSIRVILTEHATYGVVLTSIENLVDGAIQEFEESALFRVVLRTVQVADSFTTLESDDADTVAVVGVGRLEADELSNDITTGESPLLGARDYFLAYFYFQNVASTSDDFVIKFSAQILDDQPERVLFSAVLDQTYNTGTSTMSSTAFFWVAPILLKIAPFASDQYLNGMNGGLTTKDPQNDLVGSGSYKFNVGKQASTAVEALYPAVGFEPEAHTTQLPLRMELFYPTFMSTAMACYADQSSAGTTIYIHDNLHFHPRRVLDWFDGTNIVLEHEALIPNGIAAVNGWGDTVQWRADTYVAVFKRLGDVLGEDVGLHYRRWAISSPEGQAIREPKPRDCPKMSPLMHTTPFYRPYFLDDDENETSITPFIADEFRLAFPALADKDEHPFYRDNYDLVYSYNNETSGTMPGNVGNTMGDLFGLDADAGKDTYAWDLFDEKNLWTFAGIVPRRPSPFDGRGLFASEGFSDQRVKNHHEAVAVSYPSVDSLMHYTKTVAAVSFSGGFTKITLSAGAFDASFWNLFNVYQRTTAGIDHSGHQFHLGYLTKDDVSYAFPIEKQSQANFTANPPILWVAGDRTATIQVGHTLEVYFPYLPGYRVGSNLPFDTSMCGMADEIGNQGATSGGWATRFIADMITYLVPYLKGSHHVLGRTHLVCFGDHGGEIPGSNQGVLAWRRILDELRDQLWDQEPFVDGITWAPWDHQLFEEDGPYDWLIGVTDGHTRTSRRLDLTTIPREWGQSPFFQTVWGDRYRFGGMFGAQGEGHFSTFEAETFFYDFFVEPVESSKWREAMAADWCFGKLPSIGIYPHPNAAVGVRPDGVTAYTPFFHADYGMTVDGTFAQFAANLIQAHIFFEGVNVNGTRVRSLQRTSTALSDTNYMSTVAGHDAWHAIGSDENGSQRSPLMHFCMRDHRNPRRLVAYFLNDYPAANRAGAYLFDPDLYQQQIPMRGTGYRMTRYVARYDGLVEQESSWHVGKVRISPLLEPSEVWVYVFDFSSGLQFQYAYDDEELRKVPLPSDATLTRVEDIHGAGKRLMIGVVDELPDDDWKIASVDLRIFGHGRSETQ